MIKSPRKLRCLTFNPISEIRYFDIKETIGQINEDHIPVFCNVELNSVLPSKNPIVKLYSLIQMSNYKIKGLILVENFDYHKQVNIRYSVDKWKTLNEQTCNFVKSINDHIDMFEFEANIPFWIRVDFVVRYMVCGKDYWDNNNNNNYIMNESIGDNVKIDEIDFYDSDYEL